MKTTFQAALLAIAITGSAALQMNSEADDVVDDAFKPVETALDNPADEMREAKLNCQVKDEETDCDALGGTDEDAVDRPSDDDAQVLKHALWLETSYIPRADCLADQGKLTWGVKSDDEAIRCYMDEKGQC